MFVAPLDLKPGVGQGDYTKQGEQRRVAVLKATVKKYLPTHVEVVAQMVEDRARSKKRGNEKDPVMMMHQDAFAAGYHTDEYTLLGLAIKYAGLYGINVIVIGNNHETF